MGILSSTFGLAQRGLQAFQNWQEEQVRLYGMMTEDEKAGIKCAAMFSGVPISAGVPTDTELKRRLVQSQKDAAPSCVNGS